MFENKKTKSLINYKTLFEVKTGNAQPLLEKRELDQTVSVFGNGIHNFKKFVASQVKTRHTPPPSGSVPKEGRAEGVF